MKSRPYNKLVNAVWYQLIWLTAVLGTHQYEWLIVALITLHLWWSADARNEGLLMVVCAAIGCSVDSTFTALGVFQFDGAERILPIPFWLVGIWLGFIGTLRNSLSFMVQRPVLMTLAAGVFAPLSYSTAMRFDAVVFPYGTLHTMLVIGVSWVVMTPLFIRLCRAFSRQSSGYRHLASA